MHNARVISDMCVCVCVSGHILIGPSEWLRGIKCKQNGQWLLSIIKNRVTMTKNYPPNSLTSTVEDSSQHTT